MIGKEQLRQIITENNISSGSDMYALFKNNFKDMLQELLEVEMDASITQKTRSILLILTTSETDIQKIS